MKLFTGFDINTFSKMLFCSLVAWTVSASCAEEMVNSDEPLPLDNREKVAVTTEIAQPVIEESDHQDVTSSAHIIRGIILVSNEEALEGLDRAEIKGVINRDVQLPGESQTFLEELGQKYLSRPLTEEELIKIKRAIIRYYRRENHPVVAVRIPQQNTANGVVAFIVREGKIDNITFQGRRWTSKEQLERYFDMQTGEYIAQDVLLNNVAWLNRNPFRRSIVPFSPDTEDGISDLKFQNEKRFPVRFFAGADNAGTRFTGRSRLYGGLTWGHAFGIDDLVHYQYTCNTTLNKFQSHYGSYIYLFPWEHILTVFGLYETTHFGIEETKKKGKNAQASFRYTMPLLPLYGVCKQEITIGVDYKNINTNLFFIEAYTPIFSRSINITQVVMNYSLERAWEKNAIKLSLELFSSAGNILANESKASFRTLRPHSSTWYMYGRMTVGDEYKLPQSFSLAGLLRLQASTTPLLPTEQFGLGGYNTVRGYHERTFNADQAVCANLEIRSPSLPVIKKWQDACFFLGFLDYGFGYNLRPSTAYPSSGHLLGIGPGFRYQIDTHFSARIDYGFRLHRAPGESGRGGVAHLGVVGIY